MFGLPKSTEIQRQLPKKAIFEKFRPAERDKKLLDDQVSRLAIVAEISPETTRLPGTDECSAIYIVLVHLKTESLEKNNIVLLSRLIDQRMLFALQFDNKITFAVFKTNRVIFSKNKPLTEWNLKLNGLDLRAVWDNLVADICEFDLTAGENLDNHLLRMQKYEKLSAQIAALENKAMTEKQPRRKWEIADEIDRLKLELKECTYG